MVDIKVGLREEQNRSLKLDFFWGKLVSIASITEGMFILFSKEYISDRLDEYLLGADENIFGWLLVIFGVLKIMGILIHNSRLRASGIVGLSAVWGMLFMVSVLWSFGIGYPSNSFIFNGLMITLCLRVAFKGIFNGVD